MLVKTKIVGLMVALMALSAPMVYADNGGNFAGGSDLSHQIGDWHHGEGWHRQKGHHMFAKILNLSDDQVKQLKESYKKQKEAMKNIFEQIKSNREALNTEIIKAAPDMNKVNEIQAQLKTIQSQIVDNRLNSVLAIKKVLTPEQFAGYMALEKARELMKHKHHQFGKDGDSHKTWGDKSDKDQDADSQE